MFELMRYCSDFLPSPLQADIDSETLPVPMKTMHKDFRGECIYQAEVDVHFPQLTVGQTLDFAARARGKVLTGETLDFMLTECLSTPQ